MAGGINSNQQDIRHLNAQCKVVAFPWEKSVVEFQNKDLSFGELANATAKDISKYIISCSYSKNLANPSGAFSITLPNSHDWRKVLEPGYWLCIWMSNDGQLSINKKPGEGKYKIPDGSPESDNSYLRCIGNIDRVAVNYVIGENGEKDIVYEIQGRDFGMIYEEATVWLNMFKGEGKLLQGYNDRLKISSTEGLDVLLSTIHDLFLYPQALPGFNKTKDLTDIGLQFLLPRNMVKQFLGLDLIKGSDPFFGNIEGVKKFNKSNISFPVTNVLSMVKGNTWSVLKSLSLQQIHELYTELSDDGKPQLVYRMIPWSSNPQNYDKISENAIRYHDLHQESSVEINSGDIYSFNLGRDNHSRFNHYLATQMSQQVKLENNSELLNKANGVNKFPYIIESSVRRYGFRDQHTEINQTFLIKGTSKRGPNVDVFLIQNVNEFLLDIWQSSHLFDTGSISIIGNKGVRVGKTLKVDRESEYIGGKVFYIEGYVDSFTVEEGGATAWDQQLTLTRGIKTEAIKSISNIGLDRIEKLDLIGSRNRILEEAESKDQFEEVDSFVEDGDN